MFKVYEIFFPQTVIYFTVISIVSAFMHKDREEMLHYR